LCRSHTGEFVDVDADEEAAALLLPTPFILENNDGNKHITMDMLRISGSGGNGNIR